MIRHIHDRFTMDDHSYICPPYHINGGMAVLHVGKYCSIAINLHVDLGYQHNYKNVTTFPIHTLKNDVQSNVWVKGDVILHNDIWCGENVSLMGGVTIHNGAVVGANTTVRRDLLAYEIYTGSKLPEKFRFPQNIIDKLLEISWWNWNEERVIENRHLLAQSNIDRFLNEHV